MQINNRQIPVNHGQVEGRITNREFYTKIWWDNGSIGVYQGTASPSGKVAGQTAGGGDHALFNVADNLQCVA